MRLNDNGFTLVELVIAMAILLIILSFGYVMYFFGLRSFQSVEEQWKVQHEVQLGANFITNSVRNAIEIELNPNDILPWDDKDNYICLEKLTQGDQQKYSIMHISNKGRTSVTGPVIDKLQFELIKTNDNYILSFDIIGSSGESSYRLNSSVFLNNSDKIHPVVIPDSEIVAIYYKTP